MIYLLGPVCFVEGVRRGVNISYLGKYADGKEVAKRLRRSPHQYQFLHQWKWINGHGRCVYLMVFSAKEDKPSVYKYAHYLGAIQIEHREQ